MLDAVKAYALIGESYNHLFWIGGVVLIAIAFAVFVVPKFLDNALGIIALIVFVIFSSTILIATRFMNISSLTQAVPSQVPVDVQVKNVTEASFVVTWQTEDAVVGAVRYGVVPDKLNQVAVGFDPTEERHLHEVVVEDLEPEMLYYVRIISGGEEFPEGEPMEVRTR